MGCDKCGIMCKQFPDAVTSRNVTVEFERYALSTDYTFKKSITLSYTCGLLADCIKKQTLLSTVSKSSVVAKL